MYKFKLPRLRQMHFTEHHGAVFTCRGDVAIGACAACLLILTLVLIAAELVS